MITLGIYGIDNGVSRYPSDIPAAYKVKTDLGARVGRLNPAWNETVDAEGVQRRFEKAMSVAGEDFLSEVNNPDNSYNPYNPHSPGSPIFPHIIHAHGSPASPLIDLSALG